MLGIAAELAGNPENIVFTLFVTIAGVLVYAVGCGQPAGKRNAIGFAAMLATIVASMFWGAYMGPGREPPGEALLAKDMRPIPVTADGASVELQDIESLQGWGEGRLGPAHGGTELQHGDHSVDTARTHAEQIFDHILRETRQGGVSGAQVAQMSQQEWVSFLEQLGPQGRRDIGSIPFATLILRASDGNERRMILFAQGSARVLDRLGRSETTVCALRLFDIREQATRGHEAIYVGIGDRGCRNRSENGIEI